MLTAERMTFCEYKLRMKAYDLKMADEEYRMHKKAWLNREVKAEKRTGKGKSEPVYKKFKDFFDYEDLIKKIQGERRDVKEEPSGVAGRVIKYMRGKKNGAL